MVSKVIHGPAVANGIWRLCRKRAPARVSQLDFGPPIVAEAAAGRERPFFVGRQAEALTGLSRQPRGIVPCVPPVHPYGPPSQRGTSWFRGGSLLCRSRMANRPR